MPRKLVKAELPISPLAAEVRLVLDPNRMKKKFVVAVSGGADSIALLHLLLEAGFTNLVIAHFDHRLRGKASQADAAFVARLAAKLVIPFELGEGDVLALANDEKLSLETAARRARYDFLAAVAKKHRAKSVLLGHHADDQVETCLFQFLRGSGAAGLAGMKTHSERILNGFTVTIHRPLLSIVKHQLLDYLKENKIRYREDATNAVAEASRNKIRLKLLPLIGELFSPSFRTAILRSANIFAEEEQFLSSLSIPLAANEKLQVRTLLQLHPALQRRVIHCWLKNSGIQEVGFAEVERVQSLLKVPLDGRGPAKINLPGNLHARRRAGEIFIEKRI